MDHPRQPHNRNIQILRNDTLGSGSYGVVCKAMWGQCFCAAKLLHPIFFQSNDPGMVTTRRRFEQECCFLNDMKHPHIVEYLGTSHDPDSGLLVLLMELMDESLTHFLERSQPLAYHIEVDLCHDIAQALVYIHSKEIIHRDLSGNNVLLLAGSAKITDFGMSKLIDANRRMTPLTMCPGTVAYMPPEALREPPVYSKKIDCFSFGVLQIQIMTRQFPDPSPPKRVVEDSRSPTGTTEMPVLDSERRKSHIDLIDSTHTLLPTALDCLSYLEKDRPTAEDLCRQLAAVKEAPRYQLHIVHQELQTKDQQLQDSQRCTHTLQQELQDSQRCMHTLQEELQTKDQRLQDSQRCTHMLQQELQDSQRHFQQLTQQVEEKQHTIDDKETLLRELNQQLESNEQVTAEFQRNLLQNEQANEELQDTVGQLRRDLQQAMEEKQAGERRLRELNQQVLKMPQVSARPHDTITPPSLELQQPQEKPLATGDRQLQPMKQLGPSLQKTVLQHATEDEHLRPMKQLRPLPQKTVMQQKTIRDMRWHKESNAPEKMFRGSAAVDSDMAYFNGYGSTTVHSYDSNTRKWHRLPPTPHTNTTLVVVQHILTMVGGRISGASTGSLLSLMSPEGRNIIWLPILPAMPTKRYWTAAVCSGRSLIVAGGEDGHNRLSTVEVLDTDTRQWSIASSLMYPFSWATISICGERLYMLGGWDQTGRGTRSVLSCSVTELLQSCQPQPTVWLRMAPPLWWHIACAPHYASSCATLSGQLLSVGGEDKACKDASTITGYNKTTDSWEAMGEIPTARRWALVAILNGKMMVVGGLVGGKCGTATDVVEILC